MASPHDCTEAGCLGSKRASSSKDKDSCPGTSGEKGNGSASVRWGPSGKEVKMDKSLIQTFKEKGWSEYITPDGYYLIDKSQAQMSKQREPEPKPEKNQSLECAERSLAHFNEENKGSEYEIVRIGPSAGARRAGVRGFVFHTNFLAKPKDSTDSSGVTFFAELSMNGYSVLRCEILDQESLSMGRRGPIVHPIDIDCRSCSNIPLGKGKVNESDSDSDNDYYV